MDRLDAMAMLIAAVEEGSLARAARRLGLSPASVTRGVALLEVNAGERLLHRTTRKLKLTERGAAQVAIYRQVLAALASTTPSRDVLGGTISITAPEVFGRLKILPLLDRFLHEHPAVTARALLVNRVVDMIEEGIDLSLRIARLQDSVLTAVRLGTVQRLICASPDYLDRHGVPKTPNDLIAHACINLQVGGGHEPWQLRTSPAKTARLRAVPIGSRHSVNSQTAALDMSIRGHGICHPLTYQVAEDIREGRLVRLLQDYEPDPIPVHFMFHAGQRPGGIVRSFVEEATPILRTDLTEIRRRFE